MRDDWTSIKRSFSILNSLTLHRVSILLLFCYKGSIWDTKPSNVLRKPLVAQHGAKIQLFPSKPAQGGKLEKEFKQSSASAAFSQQIDPKRLRSFNQNFTFISWKERAETPHTQPSIPAPTEVVLQEPPNSFSSFFFCKKALKMRFYNPT